MDKARDRICNHSCKFSSAQADYFSLAFSHTDTRVRTKTVTVCLLQGCVSLTVCEASDPSESGDGNMGHIPIHAEGEGGGVC